MALKDKLRDLVTKNKKITDQDLKGAKRAEQFSSAMKEESQRLKNGTGRPGPNR
jgi:hypothetical protein